MLAWSVWPIKLVSASHALTPSSVIGAVPSCDSKFDPRDEAEKFLDCARDRVGLSYPEKSDLWRVKLVI